MKTYLLPSLLAALFFFSCEKKKECASSMELTANTLTPTEGETLIITTLKETDEDTYQWSGPFSGYIINQLNTLEITDLKPSHSGRYTANKSNAECNTALTASIDIKVKLKQETAPCTLTTNFVTASSIPNISFANVWKSFGTAFNTVNLQAFPASPAYPTFTVLFNSYNGNTEPEDGVYYTTDRPTFMSDQESNEISISFIYSSNYYHCRKNNKVYVKHVGGKLEVSFCNLEFASPPIAPITCSGNIRTT